MEKKKTVMKAVMRTRRAWDNHMKEIASLVGISDSYRHVIMLLSRKPGASQRVIAEFAQVTTSAVNQTVKSMILEGYVCKKTDDCDKRQSKLFLTEKGKETAEYINERSRLAVKAVSLGVMNEEQRAVVYSALDIISRNLQKVVEEGLPVEDEE